MNLYMYQPPEGEAPLLVFLRLLEPKLCRKMEYGLSLLSRGILPFREPHVKHFQNSRYADFFEYRQRMRICARIIFTLDASGNMILLQPFLKRHDRDTMRALEASAQLLQSIRAEPALLAEYHPQGGNHM